MLGIQRGSTGRGLIRWSRSEPDAANALFIEGRVPFPSSFPETAEQMDRFGLELELMDVSEIQKAEGGVICCSIVFES